MLKQIPFYSSLLGQPVGDSPATHSHVLVYGAIEVHSFGDLGCIASNKTIAAEVGFGTGRTANIISELSQAGWIKVILENGERKQIIPLLKIVRGVHSSVKGASLSSEGGITPALTYKTSNKELDTHADAFVARFNFLLKRKFRVTPKIKTMLRARMKTFSQDEIMLALEKMAGNDFYQGKNDRGWSADPEFLLRNDGQIDKFLNRKTAPGKQEYQTYDDEMARKVREKRI